MNKRITLIVSSISLAIMLLLALVALMTGINAVPVRAAPAGALPAAPLQQTTTTPTYVISDSVIGGVTYAWDEISGSGQGYYLAGDNWGSVEIDIGFYFPFYDNVYRTFRASTNGYIYFDGTLSDGGPIPLFVNSSSAPDNFIAPFGANLYMHPGVSRLYVERQSQPTRTVIEFVDTQWCCGLNDPHTFQIILYPDGRILTQYLQIRYAANPNERVVAGIENDDGSDGIAYYQNWFEEDTSLNDGLAVLYDPGDSIFGHLILDPPPAPWWEDPGQTGAFSVTLINLTGISDTFDITYTLMVSSSVVPTTSLWPVYVPSSAAFTGTMTPITIPNLAQPIFQITATIPVTAGWWDMATMYITASATSSPTLVATTTLTYGVAQRDLRISKTLVPNQPPAPGGYFRYRVTVDNVDYSGSNRPAWARSVRVTDTYPMSATLLNLIPTVGSATTTTGTFVPPAFFWDLGDIPPNRFEYIEVYMQVPESVPTGTTLLNTAWTSMTNSVERGPFDNNTVTHTMVVTERRLILDVYKDLLYPGVPVGPDQILTYTLWVENQGNVPISDVIVSDVIPQGTTFISTTWPTSTLLPDDRTLVFTISRLLNGGWNGVGFQVAISIPATTTIGTWLTNTVQVTTTASLVNFAQATGDSDSLAVQLTDPRGDVAVEKYPEMIGGVPVTPEPGGDYTFWISYTNRGYVPVYTVTLTDTLPVSYVVLLEAGPAGTAQPDISTPGQVVWNIPVLPATGAIGWTRVRIQIDDLIPDGAELVNTAEIAAAAGDNITTSNDASTVILILDAPDVTINKWVTPTGTMLVSDTVTYTVRFANTGDIAADGVRITDALPSELTNVSWITSGHPIEPVDDVPPLLVWRATRPLDPGDSGFITITGLLDPSATWPPQPILTNWAEIRTSTGEQPINDPNTAQVTNTVAMASPYVVKTGPTLALPGTLVSYTIEYGNGGLLDALDVRLTDTLPVSTTYVTHTASFTATPASGWITWEVGTIPSQTTGLTFTLVVSVSPNVPAGTPLENTVELASSTYDGDRMDNHSVWITAVGFDLTDSYKQVNGTNGLSVGSGVPVTYTIVLTNNGPFSATAVSVWDPIPVDTAYITNSLSSTGGAHGYDAVGDAITWTGTVSDYSMITVTFQVTVANAGPLPRGTIITNTTFISDGIQDFQTSVPLTITGPNLDGSYKTVNNPQPATSENITYTIVLENSGEADAVGASFIDDLPHTHVSYAGGGSASSGTLGTNDPVTWTGTVTQGGRVTITLPVQVIAGPGNHFDNVVQINDGTGEMIQRSVTVSTTRPIMQVEKTVAPSSVAQGERVTYTIAITNVGNGWAMAALMTDTIQGGTFTPGDVTASSGALDVSTPPTITWTGPVSPGFSVLVTIPVTITAMPGSDVPNVVRVDDGYGTIVADSTLVHVYSSPDLSNSSKQVDRAGARTGDTLVYTLTVVNSGELSTTFSVNDTLDPSTIFTAFVGSPPGSYGHAAGVVTWTGTVNGLSQVQLAFEAVVNAVMSGGVTNTARFEGDGGVYTDTAVTQILVPAILTATKQVEPIGPVIAGEFLTYSIVMRNVGGDDAHATFSDDIPTHTVYNPGSIQITPGHAPPIYDGSGITWGGDLGSGEAATLTFQVRVTPGTVTGTDVSNVAWMQETNEPGPLFSVAVSNTVLAPVFSATKRAEPSGVVLPGKRITYTLVVTNEGAGIARVAVTDTLPISATCIPATIEVFPATHASPVCAGGILTWQGDVDSYSFARLTYAVVVSDSVQIGAIIANSAQVQELSQPDQIVTAKVTHTVTVPILNAWKQVQPTGVILVGSEITYTIVMSNSGDAPAQVNLSDPIPSHTTYIDASAGISGGGPLPVYDPIDEQLTWSGNVAPHSVVTLTFAVTVNLGTGDGVIITNTAQVQETSLPGMAFNVTVTNSVLAPDMSIIKQVDPPNNVIVGTILSYTIVITNDGSVTAQIVLTDTVPTYTTFITGSVQVSPSMYALPSYNNEILTWQDQIDPGQAVTISFQVQIDPGTPSGTTIYNVAQMRELSDPTTVYSDTTTNVALAPTLSAAKYNTPLNFVRAGETINYDIVLHNTTLGIAWAVVTDTIPTNTTYISGSAGIEMNLLPFNAYDLPPEPDPIPDPPIYDLANNRLTWEGNLMSYTAITLTFAVTVNLGIEDGTVITNVAWVDEISNPAGPMSYLVTNTVFSEFRIYLPMVLKNY